MAKLGLWLSILLIEALVGVTALTSFSRPSIREETTQERQDMIIADHQRIIEEQRQQMHEVDLRLREVENDVSTLRGAIYGFGALLAAIQGAQLLGFKRRIGNGKQSNLQSLGD